MLHFRGSDCRRSRGLTWYDRMENLLMDLRFNVSNEYSNIYFKIEGGIPAMLLLYVDEFSLTEIVELIKVARSIFATKFEMKDLGMVHYFLDMEAW